MKERNIMSTYCCFCGQTDKIFLLHTLTYLSSSSLISHENEQEQRRQHICTTKDLSDSFREFKSVRLIFPEDRSLQRSFNNKASHKNKTDKSNNNKKVPASYKQSSFEATVEQLINLSDNSYEANFPSPLMSVDDVYNGDAHPLPKNTILITADSTITGISGKSFSSNFKSVKVRCFSDATIDEM